MSDPRRHAAALAVAFLLAVPSAGAAQPTLLAQIDDATPTPTADAQPPLSEDPPQQLGSGGGGGEEPANPGSADEPLPETGLETGLIALLGLGLIASGSGLRLTLGRDAG